MIKIAPPVSESFHTFKCGEIFCISPAVYNVTCCLCAGKMNLEQFSNHFEVQHLALVEDSIHLEVLEFKTTETLTNYVDESVNVKDEGPEVDPIKHEDIPPNANEDNKSWQQIVEKKPKTEHEVNVDEELEVNTVVKKIRVRNRRKRKIKACDVKEPEDRDNAVLVEEKGKSFDENKDETEFDLNRDGSDLKIFGNPDGDLDKDWLVQDESSKSDSEVDDSVKDELPYPCHECKRSYRSKNGLRKHNQIAHNPKKEKPQKNKEAKTEHKCDLCGEVFRIARDLRFHKWKHTGIFCDICGKKFTQPSNMMRHKQRHTGIKNHKCEECGKEFFTDKELKSHIICHTGLMPVICELCGKQCRHRGVLTAHMRRHTGERPAKCEVCGKCFYSIHDLNVHAVAHTSERPFKCDICGSTFQRRKALRVHKLIHSTDRKHVCKICGKGFAMSGGLKSHMRSHNAALEKSTIESAQQPIAPKMLENSSSQTGNYTSGLTTTNIPGAVIPSENSMLAQYMN